MELNTFGHAICALLIYVLWWEKPFEVDYPTEIRGQSILDILALDIMRSEPSNAVMSYQRELGAYLARDPRYNALAEVGLKNMSIVLPVGYFLRRRPLRYS